MGAVTPSVVNVSRCGTFTSIDARPRTASLNARRTTRHRSPQAVAHRAAAHNPPVTTNRLLTAATVIWLAAVAAFELGGTVPADVGASPDAVADGEVWRLLSSSLLIDAGLPALQLALLAAATALVIRRAGPRVWWVAALVGHVVSALLAYASIGVAIALGSDSADRVADDWDYGISCVLAALTGVLFADALGRVRAHSADPARAGEKAAPSTSRCSPSRAARSCSGSRPSAGTASSIRSRSRSAPRSSSPPGAAATASLAPWRRSSPSPPRCSSRSARCCSRRPGLDEPEAARAPARGCCCGWRAGRSGSPGSPPTRSASSPRRSR